MTTTATLSGDRLFARLQNYIDHPTFYDDITEEVVALLSTSRIACAMAQGDAAAASLFWRKVWKYVEGFSPCVEAAMRDFAQIEAPLIDQEVRADALAWLTDQCSEECWHMDLWPETAARAGVRYHQLRDEPLAPSVAALIENMSGGPTLVHRMLRLVCTEIVAQQVSRFLLASPRFMALHQGKAEWCTVHATSRDHERLGHRLAQLVADIGYGPQPTEDLCRREILYTARLFHAMGE